MSLVLEALKKLDREKGRDERGFVVMAAAPWPTRAARRGRAWAAVGLAAVAAAAVAFLMRAPRPAAPALPATSAAASAASPSAPAATPTPAKRAATAPPVPRATPATEGRDPTPLELVGNGRKRAASPPAEPALRLQAVSERDGQPIAIVNDRLVRVGDEIEGMRVLAIRPDEVDLEIKGRRMTLRF